MRHTRKPSPVVSAALKIEGALQRDLLRQIRELEAGAPSGSVGRLEQATRLTELMLIYRQNNITPEDFSRCRDEFLEPMQGSRAGNE